MRVGVVVGLAAGLLTLVDGWSVEAAAVNAAVWGAVAGLTIWAVNYARMKRRTRREARRG